MESTKIFKDIVYPPTSSLGTATPSRKSAALNSKFESKLSTKDLHRLQDAFTGDDKRYGSKLCLTKEQFCNALEQILKKGKGSKKEYGVLYDKIDVRREGVVDWEMFADHMKLEFHEKDDREKSMQVPQWKDMKMMKSPHKSVIQRLAYIRNTNRFIVISKEGTISTWDVDLRFQRSIKTATESCKARDLWVTHFVVMQNFNKIALSFTSKEIAIYDMGSKVEFSCQYKIMNLQHTPLYLDYWYNPTNQNEAILVFGDVGGYVNAIFFNSAQIALFERPNAPAGERKDTCLNVDLIHVAASKYKHASYTKYMAHEKEWCRQVRYSRYFECFISCSTGSVNSLMIGWMEKRIKQKPTQSAGSKKLIQRKSAFNIPHGVNAFDYNERLNQIATAGVNHNVCLWNPYVNARPNGVLRGHVTSVVQIQFIKTRGQLISLAKDRVLRIWDVQLQVCLQRLAGKFPKGQEVSMSMYFDEGKDRMGVEHNRLFVSLHNKLTVIEMKPDIKDRIMSHDRPVVAAIYNSVYNQVISACEGGVVTMWMIDTGQKVKQFKKCHGDSEVTCLAQDVTETRLFTGSVDGTLKMWDFNGQCLHTLFVSSGHQADIGQILCLKRCVIVVGWSKTITVFRNTSFGVIHNVHPGDWKSLQGHQEDILSTGFMPPNTLATGSYDGEIVIWNTNSEHPSRHLVHRAASKRPDSRASTVPPISRENTNMSLMCKPISRAQSRMSIQSRASSRGGAEAIEPSYAVSKLVFLVNRKSHPSKGGNGVNLNIDTRKSTPSDVGGGLFEPRKETPITGGANLVSCGGNGIVRFWNSSNNTLLAEFTAHTHAGSITMATDVKNQYLVTGDVDGVIKVWDITEYAVHAMEELITVPPPLTTQFQPHQDMVNTLELCERSDRIIVLTASSDCSVALWDINGNRIGTFGQEEHWRIDEVDTSEGDLGDIIVGKVDDTTANKREQIKNYIDTGLDDTVNNDNPENSKVNAWDSTLLGKAYQESRMSKRERRQPGTIKDRSYPTLYSALAIPDLIDVELPEKPDPDDYFFQRPSSTDSTRKLPALADTLMTAYDEKSLFPSYIREYEMKMKTYHAQVLSDAQPKRGTKHKPNSLQQIGSLLGDKLSKDSAKSISMRQRALSNYKHNKSSPSTGPSRRTSVSQDA